eukprot:gene9983-biopygen5532
MVPNYPILDSKVVTDELGQLGRPALGWSLTSLAGSPGRPGRLAPAWRAGGLLPGKGTREELRRGRSAQAMMEPPHSYHRRGQQYPKHSERNKVKLNWDKNWARSSSLQHYPRTGRSAKVWSKLVKSPCDWAKGPAKLV